MTHAVVLGWVVQSLIKCFVYIVLSCSNLELHQTLEVKNIFKQGENNAAVNV